MEKNLNLKQVQEFFSKPLEENTTSWPKEVPSRYGDIIFRLVKVMPDRAKYELIDAETGKTWETGGRVYGTVNQLKASAEDTIKPQGGRQSSQFESVFEASLGSTKSQSLANAINSAMLQIDDSMSYTDFANAVASILIDEYGTHNFTPFMEVLHARLGMNEATEESVSAPIFRKDKNYPNFLNVYVKYYVPGGFTTALGQRTASGQERDKNSAEALKIANSIAKNLQSKFNLEDIDVEDRKNGTVAIFAVSDDFINMQEKDFNIKESVNENALLKQAKLSSAEYQKAKKLKDFNKDDYKWNPGESLYIKLNETDDQAIAEASKKEYDALLDKEHELTSAYMKDKTDANWKKLSDIRKKGKKLEKELEDQGLLEASKTFGHSSDEKKKSIAQTLAETIKLGEGVIEEELCPKGKAYIKRRKAAGEKSSAYLSGRAVKVCKGQMSGRKKRKSKKK